VKGTWQGSGTFQTSSADLGGLAGVAAPVAIAVVVVIIVEFILSIIVWLAIAAGIVLALAAAGLIWWLRGAPERKAAYDAAYRAAFEARRAAPAAAPQVRWPERPAVTNNYHGPQFHFHGPDAEAQMARVIRSLPGQAGDAITEGE
jgi:hypothetical protein